jgi:hypothetical protein
VGDDMIKHKGYFMNIYPITIFLDIADIYDISGITSFKKD